MVIGLIDIIVLITLVLSILCALYHGLVRELLGISSWILAGICALYSYTPMQSLMHKFIENEKIAGVVGAAVIALIVLVVMTLLNAKITSRLRASSLSGLDRILGFLFGALRALLLMALVYIGASMVVSRAHMDELTTQNISLPYIQKMAQGLEKFMPEGLKKDLQSPLSDETTDDVDTEKSSESEMQDLKKQVKEAVEKQKAAVKKAGEKAVQDKAKKAAEKIADKVKKTEDAAYKESERESMDDMIESILEEG